MEEVNTTPDEPKFGKVYLVAGGVFFALIVAILLVYFYTNMFTTLKEEQPSPYALQKEQSQELLKGDDQLSLTYQAARAAWEEDRDYVAAVEKYEEAIALAGNPAKTAQIKYELAVTKSWVSDDREEAIRLLKEVAADPKALSVLRGAAVERMGSMVYGGDSDVVLGAIYASDDFYEDFGVEGDFASSMKNLFEYGSSLYPTAYMQYWIANWYASDLIALAQGGTPRSNYSVRQLESLVEETVQKGGADLGMFRQVYPDSFRIPAVMLRKAILAVSLETAGSSVSAGDPDELFQAAFSEGRIIGASDAEAWTLFRWALYQAQNNFPEGVSDARKTLSKLYESDRYLGTYFVSYLRREGGLEAGSTAGRRQIEFLAGIDPGFRAFLEEELGWENLPKLQQ